MQKLIEDYIQTGSKIHKQRAERLQEANHYIKKQITTINNSLDEVSKVQAVYNKEIDQMIGSLDVVNQIQSNVNKTIDNLNNIDKVLDRIEAKLEFAKKIKAK